MVNQAEIELDDIQLHLDAPVASENDWVSIVNVEDISEEKNLSYNLPVAPRSEEMDHADMASNNVRLNRQLSAKDAEVSHL